MRRNLILVFLLAVIATGAAPAEPTDASNYRPLAVETVSYVDVHYVHPGSTFFVKLKNSWSSQGCFFFTGQVLQGRIELATRRGKGQKESQLAVSFADSPCLGSKTKINLVLTAVMWDAGVTGIPHVQYPTLDRNIMQLGPAVPEAQGIGTDGISLMAISDQARYLAPLKAGDVRGLDGITLEIGKGPDRSTLLRSTKRDVYLEKEAMLVLVPENIAFAKSNATDVPQLLEHPATATLALATSPSAANIPARTPPPLPPPVEFQACEPPACAVDLPSDAHGSSGAASKSIGILDLGYAPRPQQGLDDLNDDVALGWLGPHQLLVAFNPHKLIARDRQGGTGAAVRRIHAVVLDPATSKVLSAADWFLPDSGEFLWQLPGGRVLVHVGNELRVYREGMQVERQIPLGGPLAFVRLSPNGELLAIAALHEVHTPEQHTNMRESLGAEPPENVEISVLDKDFHTIAKTTTSSEVMPPALLNEGQVRLQARADKKYRIALDPWSGDSKTIARFSSACVPELSSFAPDLLLVATCALDQGTHEYRVIRPDGKVVLRGQTDLQVIHQSAQGNDHDFAVKILHAAQVMMHGSVIHASDLDYEEVRIFQSKDGKHITSVRLAAPPPTHGAYALSPDGAQLAVIADAKVSLFPVPTP